MIASATAYSPGNSPNCCIAVQFVGIFQSKAPKKVQAASVSESEPENSAHFCYLTGTVSTIMGFSKGFFGDLNFFRILLEPAIELCVIDKACFFLRSFISGDVWGVRKSRTTMQQFGELPSVYAVVLVTIRDSSTVAPGHSKKSPSSPPNGVNDNGPD